MSAASEHRSVSLCWVPVNCEGPSYILCVIPLILLAWYKGWIWPQK